MTAVGVTSAANSGGGEGDEDEEMAGGGRRLVVGSWSAVKESALIIALIVRYAGLPVTEAVGSHGKEASNSLHISCHRCGQ